MHSLLNKTTISIFSLVLLLTGCSQSTYLSESWIERTEQFSQDMIEETAPEKTQLFVYRLASSPTNADAINIYVDGSYLTSLHENRFKEVTLCAGKHTINAQFTRQDPAYNKKHNVTHSMELLKSGHAFLRITYAQKEPIISIEPMDQAIESLGQTYRQTHALPRTHKSTVDCVQQ